MAQRKPLILLIAALAFVPGCAGVTVHSATPRVSEMTSSGDDVFRASQRLVIEGLDAEVEGNGGRALSRYERALQIDASNPWAYLALSRHYVEVGDARNALSHLDRGQGLLESLGLDTPGARALCDGLRGSALALQGRDREAQALLASAARSAPSVWADGELSAAELR